MRHVLVSTKSAAWGQELRDRAPIDTVVLSVAGLDETLDTLARSARIDAVVTDDPAVKSAIRQEIPGNLPVLVAAGLPPASVWQRLEESGGET